MTEAIFHEARGEGEPLFLLNGIMMTTASWGLQTSVLQQHFRCILHDFRGQLRSARPAGPYSMSMHVDDLATLMDDLGIESAHLVGTSYGGEVGMLFAIAHPQRVRSLSVISCVHRPDAALREAVRRWADTSLEEPERLWDTTVSWNYSPEFIDANPAFVEAAHQRIASLPPDWFRALAGLCEAFNALDVDPSRIDVPTLVVCGANDRLKPPRFSEAIAAAIPGARLEIVPNAGHAVVIEKPHEVNRLLLQFLGTA